MHIITHRRIRDAQTQHADCASALDQWYRVMKGARMADFSDLRRLFGAVDKVGDLFVFNVGGHQLRLIAAIHFNTGKVFVRHVLTHREYDMGRWKS